jgi:hypothetical protein
VAERLSFTAVRSLDRILDEAKLFLAVRDELDGRARSGSALPVFKRATGRLKCNGSRLQRRIRSRQVQAELLAAPRTRGVLRDEVAAERKSVYLRNVGQGSSGPGEGEACSTLAMSSQRGSGSAPR